MHHVNPVRARLGRMYLALACALVLAFVSTLALATPSFAQTAGVSADDLLGPVTTGVNSAIVGGFVIAAAILVAFAIYKIVRRFA